MAEHKIVAILIILVLASVNALVTDREVPLLHTQKPNKPDFDIKNKTFQNYIDHFSGVLKGKFSQRYYLVDEYWDKTSGPFILYLCGENECLFPESRQYPIEIAKHYNGLYIAIEHRYYGVSQPVPDWSLKNLEYLTHEQALADYAYFIESTNQECEKNHDYIPKWIIIGGSYAGGLSAWFRLKYPHLVAGALSSSGVVIPLLDFWQFDKQIVEDFLEDGIQCFNIIKYYHKVVEQKLFNSSSSERTKFISLFSNDTDISNDEFLFYFADMAVLFPQYSARKHLCTLLKRLNESGIPIESQMQEYAAEGLKFGTSLDDYTFKKMRSEKIVQSDLIRQWTYQYCTSYAWFQTPYSSRPLRYTGMNLEYWYRYCKGGLGVDVIPKINHTAAMFGSDLIAKTGSNIFFTQARNDPWRWVGINEKIPENNGIEVGVMECEDCGHCRELYTPMESDPAEVKEVRKRITETIGKWLKQ